MLILAALLFTATDWDLNTYRNAKRESERLGLPLVVYVGKENPPSDATMDAVDAIFCWVEKLPGFPQPCVLVLQPKAAWAYKLPVKADAKAIQGILAPVKAEPRGVSPSYRAAPARGC